MGWFDSFSDDHNQVHNTGSLTHDALGGAVAYEVAKAYEDHLAKNGQPDSHAKAKEVIAGLLGAAVTRLGETKGRDLWDQYNSNQVQEVAEEKITQTILVDQYPDQYRGRY